MIETIDINFKLMILKILLTNFESYKCKFLEHIGFCNWIL